MKKIRLILCVFILLAGTFVSAQNTVTPFEKGSESGFLPFLKDGFRPQVSIAPQIAYVNFHQGESSGMAFGGEIALQCPMMCTSKNYIRQQISVLYYNDSDLDFKVLEITLNPEYRFLIKPTFELAAGPSIGYLRSTSGTESSQNLFSYGISTSATWHIGDKFFVGISARQNWAGSDLGHIQGILKLGYKI